MAFVIMKPLMGMPMVTGTQLPVFRLVAVCRTKFVPGLLGKNTSGRLP